MSEISPNDFELPCFRLSGDVTSPTSLIFSASFGPSLSRTLEKSRTQEPTASIWKVSEVSVFQGPVTLHSESSKFPSATLFIGDVSEFEKMEVHHLNNVRFLIEGVAAEFLCFSDEVKTYHYEAKFDWGTLRVYAEEKPLPEGTRLVRLSTGDLASLLRASPQYRARPE